MATENDLFQIINEFTSIGAVTLPLGPSSFLGLVEEPQVSPAARGSIVLPNGAKFDPHQTYDSPMTPKEVTVRRLLKPSGAWSLEETELKITDWYNFNVMPVVGSRGTLYGTAYDISQSSATARLLQASLNWTLPRQIVTNIGGAGNTTPGIKTALLTLRFDLLTVWTYTT